MPGKNQFNDEWLSNPKDKEWLLKVPDDLHRGKCKLCPNAPLKLESMGESALTSHADGVKHKARLAKTGLAAVVAYMPRINSDKELVSESNAIPESTSKPAGKQVSIDEHVVKDDVLDAEILWTLRTVKNHHSYKSNEDIRPLFRRMFSDSSIAASFTCGEQKTKYLAIFGLARYFKEKLLVLLSKQIDFVFFYEQQVSSCVQVFVVTNLVDQVNESMQQIYTCGVVNSFLYVSSYQILHYLQICFSSKGLETPKVLSP